MPSDGYRVVVENPDATVVQSTAPERTRRESVPDRSQYGFQRRFIRPAEKTGDGIANPTHLKLKTEATCYREYSEQKLA